jgi:hypothetical protein
MMRASRRTLRCLMAEILAFSYTLRTTAAGLPSGVAGSLSVVAAKMVQSLPRPMTCAVQQARNVCQP